MSVHEIWVEPAAKLRSSEPYRKLKESLGSVQGLPIPAAAWICDLLARDLGRRLLVVVPREAEALAWVDAADLMGRGADYFSTPSLTPYQQVEVSLQVRAQEAVGLDRALAGVDRTVVCTPRALFRRLPTRKIFSAGVFELAAGDDMPMEDLAQHLSSHGYARQDLVSEVGEFAVRGGVFDCYPPGEERPLRFDFLGDTVDSIRSFDPADQRSREKIDSIRLLPLSLFAAGADQAERLAERMEVLAEDQLGPEGVSLIEDLREQGRFSGWESYLSLVAEESGSLHQLMTASTSEPGILLVVFHPEEAEAEILRHQGDLARDYDACLREGRVAVAAETLEVSAAEVSGVVGIADIVIGELGGVHATDFLASSTDVFHDQIPRFPREVETAQGRGERLFYVGLPDHLARFERLAEHYEIARGSGGAEFVSGDLERGFRLPAAGLVVVSERQLFRPAPAPLRGRSARYGPFLSSLRDLRVGDYVVHEDHGIGQFIGLRVLDDTENDQPELPSTLRGLDQADAAEMVEVMEIEYRNGQTLLFPPSRLDRVQRYGGIEGVKPRLDRLGGTSWSRTKERVRSGMREMAGDLLRLYAERQLAQAPVMAKDSDLQAQVEAAFEFEPTEDQLEAVAAIKADLINERPMDRLLCGDVGFGKTEVSMRAAFKVVDAGYQVAVLAPTTILADQHLETFRQRFAEFPVEIEMISRFRSAAEIRKINERLTKGAVDILIGTHRLLSRDISFAKLGLLIIDEEQRFGVAQKEKLKELRKDVHVLSMTATPVPRTLQLALAGVRDMSTIQTAPRDRMAVETAILPFSKELVREVIESEIDRGGQVYYVHNRVAGITEIAAELKRICPRARLVIGHGQLGEQELARRMHAFKRGEYDVLLATTIIENGIDIPNVNTILVHRADRYGLAQLYQLRGRVGRSTKLGYCYLLVPSDRVLPEISRKRLEAIREFTELGSGFRVAARDLEIRGAGNLLGAEQSGHISAVGLETYLKMLEEAVRELKGEVIEDAPSVAINLPVRLTIPTDYLGDANLRMEIYRKIAASQEEEEEILAELRDRFGDPPEPVRALVAAAGLKRIAESLRVQSISCTASRLHLRFRKDTRANPERLIRLVSEQPGVRFSPTGVLTADDVPRDKLIERARELLADVAGDSGVEGAAG